MSQHNYINPAFCQQSEFYQSPSTTAAALHHQSMTHHQRKSPTRVHRSVSMRSVGSQQRQKFSVHQRQHSNQEYQHSQQVDVHHRPPRPGPKPQINLNTRYAPTEDNSNPASSRYEHLPHRSSSRSQLMDGFALVPLSDLPNTGKGRYAFIPAQEAKLLRSTSVQRMAKSQDDLDRSYGSNFKESNNDVRDSSFTSLPPCINNTSAHNDSTTSATRMKSAFSSDFVSNKSLILVDQKNQQRYAIVPTAEDEELVDANEEIIQMHNGRAHRYAVIPTASDDDEDDDDREEETCLSGSDFEMSPTNEKYATIKAAPPGYRNFQPDTKPQPMYNIPSPFKPTTPVVAGKQQQIQLAPQTHEHRTPSKNHVATQKLLEILSTPRKNPVQMDQRTPSSSEHAQQNFSYHTPTHRSRYPQQTSTPKHSDQTPPKLQYKHRRPSQQPNDGHNTSRAPDQYHYNQQEQNRTTAIISPRLAQDAYRSYCDLEYEPDDLNKSWQGGSIQNDKVSRATATIGAVSLMLILAGAMNSGLCLYMISVFGRLYYLDLGIVAGFAVSSLGILGFKSRHSEWIPNRNYISGYVLVTMFSLLNCCGLLVLLALRPLPGTPLHDVTTGVILGLSSLSLLVISLGVLTTRWCRGPPPDNRVDVYNA